MIPLVDGNELIRILNNSNQICDVLDACFKEMIYLILLQKIVTNYLIIPSYQTGFDQTDFHFANWQHPFQNLVLKISDFRDTSMIISNSMLSRSAKETTETGVQLTLQSNQSKLVLQGAGFTQMKMTCRFHNRWPIMTPTCWMKTVNWEMERCVSNRNMFHVHIYIVSSS